MTLSQRLALILLLTASLLLAVSLVMIMSNARSTVDEELDSSALTVMQLLSAALVSLPTEPSARADFMRQLQKSSGLPSVQITLLDPASGASIWSTPETVGEEVAAPDWFVKQVAPDTREFRQRVIGAGEVATEIVLVADPKDEIEETWRESRSIVVLIIMFTVLSLLLVILTIRRALRPLGRISEGLQVVTGGDFGARVAIPGLPDLDPLVKQFNQMASTLQEQRHENQQLRARMLQIQETERRNLARDLHDELGQSITAIKALAVTGAGSQSKAIVDVSSQMYDSVRSLMRQLRPPLLDELGLLAALEKLADDWNAAHEDSFCALAVNGSLDGLDEELGVHLFRCVQEGLNNVAKHALADRVDVTVKRSAEDIQLRIADNGHGFDPNTSSHGMGLAGLRERAEACNGTFSLETAIGEGVIITLHFPLQSSNAL